MSITLWNDEQDRPLQQLRVIDLSVMLPGPFLTRLLAQYGADVIKIESIPDGDPMRSLKDSAISQLLNQGKRSVGINLKVEKGKEIIRQLANEADIFVEGFRGGVMDEMGLGYSELSLDNPDLLYVSLRGFSGQLATHSGHDLNFIASSGCGEWFLENGPNYSTQFADLMSGAMLPLTKILFHLANPERKGMHLVSSMDESFRTLYLPRAFDAFKAAESHLKDFGYMKYLNGNQPHSRYYRCRDGRWITLNAVQKKHWENFCEVMDKQEWKSRMEDKSLILELEKLFLDAPSTYWEALASNREVCLVRVLTWDEHFSHSTARPQLATDPMTWCGFMPNPNLLQAPEMGHDTFSVVHSLGISHKELSELLKEGVLYQSP